MRSGADAEATTDAKCRKRARGAVRRALNLHSVRGSAWCASGSTTARAPSHYLSAALRLALMPRGLPSALETIRWRPMDIHRRSPAAPYAFAASDFRYALLKSVATAR